MHLVNATEHCSDVRTLWGSPLAHRKAKVTQTWAVFIQMTDLQIDIERLMALRVSPGLSALNVVVLLLSTIQSCVRLLALVYSATQLYNGLLVLNAPETVDVLVPNGTQSYSSLLPIVRKWFIM